MYARWDVPAARCRAGQGGHGLVATHSSVAIVPNCYRVQAVGRSFARASMFALLQLLVLFIGLSGYHGAHTHLLIKVHKPTSAMLHRFCHLNDERVASDFLADLHVQHYMPADIVEMPFRWCLPYSILHKDNLTTLWGNESSIMHAKRWELSGISELSFFAINFLANASTLDFLWVIEQDVAWQGNLFDILATFATWTEDLLCLRPDVGRVGDSWSSCWSGEHCTAGGRNNFRPAHAHVE